MKLARTLILGSLAAGLAFGSTAEAQTTMPTALPTAPRGVEARATAVVPAAQLEAGSNSYTEGQARSRMESNGFSAINNLRKDDNGFWRATATHGSTSGDVAMDFQGRIAHGAGVASIGARMPGMGATTGTTMGTTTSPMAAPSTITPMGRAPDGTPGNPPGTAMGRAVDGALGTNTTGANPAPLR